MFPYIHIFGKTLGSYGFLIAIGIFLSVILALRRAHRLSICCEDIFIVSACSLGFGLMGGTILYTLVSYPIPVILRALSSGNFSLFGGMVFYGGLIGGVLGALLGIRIAKCDLQRIESAIVPFIPLGHAFGRIGCVLAGCCHGMPYDGPLALYYPASVTGLPPHQGYFPVQLLEAVLNVGLCFVLLCIGRKEHTKFTLLVSYLGGYATLRFLLEFFRGDAVRGIYYGLSLSQWIALGMFLLVGLFFAKKLVAKHLRSLSNSQKI